MRFLTYTNATRIYLVAGLYCIYLVITHLHMLSVFYTVVNMSFVTFIGEPIVVPESIRVTIDCGPVIDQANMSGKIFNIIWRKNGRVILNGSEVNVVLAPDNRRIVITETFLRIRAQVEAHREAVYECEFCGHFGTCVVPCT